MEGRLNKKTGTYEILYRNKWVDLNEDNWNFAIKKISNKFLIAICNDVVDIYKEKALNELKWRLKYKFDLKSLWNFSLDNNPLLGALALNEIFDRSGRLYMIPQYLNR